MTKIAVYQMTSGVRPEYNATTLLDAIRVAGKGEAEMLFTPEMSLFLDRDRDRARPNVIAEDDSEILRELRLAASNARIWLALGSLAVLREDGKWANRSLLIAPSGAIVAAYDKMHMFDVQLASGESWRESNAYAPGDRVVTVDDTPLGRLGLTICYDLRFPALFEELGRRRCDAIAIPAAFTVPTGKAHWHTLMRARAIEASAFVIAAAQVGTHEDGRTTYGHSLVVDPWGEVLLDMGGDKQDLAFIDLDLGRIAEVRAQLPSLANKRPVQAL